MPTWTEEFPDYTDMPPLPVNWEDHSWRFDQCPSFQTPEGLLVFIDFVNRDDREFPDCDRYTIHLPVRAGDEMRETTLFTTESWVEFATYLTRYRMLTDLYGNAFDPRKSSLASEYLTRLFRKTH